MQLNNQKLKNNEHISESKEKIKIHIIGAGISGLIAAKVLEESGYSPILIESSSNVGGRIKTIIKEGYQLDKGFQVLLTEYPKAKKHLDYRALRLQKLVSGACIFINNKQYIIGNPIRNISLLIPTLFSDIGNISDKLKILKLYLYLRFKSIEKIFSSKELKTIDYLEKWGFSKKIIENFFEPFFAGIFLETELSTSSRMFEFVFKMFAQGDVAIPESGIQEIPYQIAKKLTRTNFMFNTQVDKILEGEIILKDKSKIKSDYTIIATEAKNLLEGRNLSSVKWKSCVNFYFEIKQKSLGNGLIGLLPGKNTVINNIFFVSGIKSKITGAKQLLSVTVIDSKSLSNGELIDRVKYELKKYCRINVIRLISQFNVTKSLPDLHDISNTKTPSEFQISDTIFLAGDHELNPSLNAAITSGEMSALQLIKVDKLNNP
ncbi:MAG: oxidoreductase [Cryomorphaceae bacterium]|nr:MAG: oxidoreductase [Cryomorphaceae bacterium]